MKQNYRLVQRFQASKGARLLNFIVDYIAISIFRFCIGYAVGFLYMLTDAGFLLTIIYSFNDKVMSWLIGSAMYILYYFLFEKLSNGRTIGKMFTGTRVLDINGLPPSSWEYAMRSISRIVPFDFLSFLWSRDGWHDSWSDTKVVNWKPYKEAMESINSIDELGKIA